MIQTTAWVDRHPASYFQQDYLDLKANIALAGVNTIPIKLRPTKLHSKATPSYEVVYGHRRHRACLELGIPVLAVVDVLSDEELVVQLHAENRHRKNLTSYERGVSYARMLERGLFDKRRPVLAAKLGVCASEVSRLLYLAKLPDELLAILASPLELAIHDVDKLRPALANHYTEVMKRVARIAETEGKLPTKEALKRLTDFKSTPKAATECEVRSLEVKGQQCGQLTIDPANRVSIALSIPLTRREVAVLHTAVRRVLKGVLKRQAGHK